MAQLNGCAMLKAGLIFNGVVCFFFPPLLLFTVADEQCGLFMKLHWSTTPGIPLTETPSIHLSTHL